MSRRVGRRRVLLWGLAAGLGGVAVLGAGSAAVCTRRTAAVPDAGPPDARTVAARLAEALSEVFQPARLAAAWPGGRPPGGLPPHPRPAETLASATLVPHHRTAETLAPDALTPEILTPEILAAEILACPDLRAAVEADCPATRRALLRARFARDFATGAVEVVDRLVVARSECLIAALCLGAARGRPA